MRFLPFLAFLFCVSCAVHVSWPKEDELERAYFRSTVVSYVVVNKEASTLSETVFNCVGVFKGDCKRLRTTHTDRTPYDERVYLVMAVEDEGLILEMLYPITAADQLTDADLAKLDGRFCYSKELEDSYRNTYCTYIYSPVCGCDNKTYGNECEARSHGIPYYRRGKCEDENR